MKVGVVQVNPIKGQIERNIDCHERYVELAAANGADILIFPELSITGYEPTLANDLATTESDTRFDSLQELSNTRDITIGVGVPLRQDSGVSVSMILFQPHKPREVYSKHYIHRDEEEFFVAGKQFSSRIDKNEHVALAICYELSVPEHAERAFTNGAQIYIASVAKDVNGLNAALVRLGNIAREYSMTVLMANCVGTSDGLQWGGKTSVWSPTGTMLRQLDDRNEGLILVDTVTGQVVDLRVSPVPVR